METTKTLQAEHNAVLHVLDQLEHAAEAAAGGQPVPANVFADIEEFFRVFVDRCHHGKEELVLFPKLMQTGLPAALEMQHEEGRQLAKAYALAAERYVAGSRASAVALQRAAADYEALLRSHIDMENAGLLPAIERDLSAQDQELADAFEQIETERIGAGTHERLHHMIETLAGRISPFLSASGPVRVDVSEPGPQASLLPHGSKKEQS